MDREDKLKPGLMGSRTNIKGSNQLKLFKNKLKPNCVASRTGKGRSRRAIPSTNTQRSGRMEERTKTEEPILAWSNTESVKPSWLRDRTGSINAGCKKSNTNRDGSSLVALDANDDRPWMPHMMCHVAMTSYLMTVGVIDVHHDVKQPGLPSA